VFVVCGIVGGVTFSGVLSLLEGRRRFAAWAAAGNFLGDDYV